MPNLHLGPRDSPCNRRSLRLGTAVSVLAAVYVLAAWLPASPARADEPPLPLVTAKNAQQHAGQPATLETTVVEVKFAERRKLHFLSATANFRSEDNLPVAIRAADLDQFHKAGIKDLSAHYTGRKIRARGKVLRDEGQWLLVVTSPEHIALLDAPEKPAAPAKPPAPAELVIVNEQGKRTVLAVPLADDLPRSKVTLEHDGQQDTYEGAALAALLERAEVRLGAEARGSLLGRYLVVTAQDGYAAVFSVAEVDPFFAERPALLADRLNGEGLPAKRSPLQVVVPADKHRRRWVGQVIKIEVRNALDKPAAAKP